MLKAVYPLAVTIHSDIIYIKDISLPLLLALDYCGRTSLSPSAAMTDKDVCPIIKEMQLSAAESLLWDLG